jgi:hypothetical protein
MPLWLTNHRMFLQNNIGVMGDCGNSAPTRRSYRYFEDWSGESGHKALVSAAARSKCPGHSIRRSPCDNRSCDCSLRRPDRANSLP